MPSAAITSAMQAFVSSSPSVGPYWSALAQDSSRDPLHHRGERLRRERARVGQAAGERDHLGPRGDAIRSRIAEDFMTWVRDANRPA